MVKLLKVQDVATMLHCSRTHAMAVMDKAGCYNMGTKKNKMRMITEEGLWRYLNSTFASEQVPTEKHTKKRATRSNVLDFKPVPGNPMGCIVPREALARPKRKEA